MPPKKNETWVDKLKSLQVAAAVLIMGGAAYASHIISIHRIEAIETKVKEIETQGDVDHDILIELRANVKHIKETVDKISEKKESGK